MFMHVTKARYCGDYKVWVSFNDGAEGEIDLFSELYGELFEPLKDKEFFSSCSSSFRMKLLTGIKTDLQEPSAPC
jgi:hypothetical protein